MQSKAPDAYASVHARVCVLCQRVNMPNAWELTTTHQTECSGNERHGMSDYLYITVLLTT